MHHIAAALLFDRDGRLLVYLRDSKPDIPFPNHWDFFGGHVEDGETPEQALVREVREEIGVELKHYEHFRDYTCEKGDAYPNVKHIYWARIDGEADDLMLREGQRIIAVALGEHLTLRWANILGRIVDEFVNAGVAVSAAPVNACPTVTT